MTKMAEQNGIRRKRSPWLTAGRLLLVFVFFAGALYNLFVTLRAPAVELGRLIELSPLAFIRELASSVVLPYAGAFVIIVILFELSIAISVLLRVRVRRRAYMASLVFFVILLPLIGWYALSNLIWALPVLGLIRYDREGEGR
jgi:hypothetical protein